MNIHIAAGRNQQLQLQLQLQLFASLPEGKITIAMSKQYLKALEEMDHSARIVLFNAEIHGKPLAPY